MAEFSLSKKVAQDYLQSKRSFDGQSVNYAVPPFLNGLVASNGALLASDDVIARAIQRNDPQGYQSVVRNIPETMDRASISGNTINYTEAPDEGFGEDWLAPAMMLASFGVGGAMNGAFSGVGAGAGGMPVASPWAMPAGGSVGASPLSSMAGNVVDMVAPASTGWGSSVGTAAAGAAAGGGMDLGFDMTGFMGGDPWSAGAPSSWQNLMGAPLGGVNLGSAADPYSMGWGNMPPTGSAGWDAVFSGGANLPSGGPWNDFAANPYGSGVPSGSTLSDLVKKYGPQAAKALLGANGGGSALSRTLGFGAEGDDLMRLLGGVGSAALGAYGANKQAESLEKLARDQMAAEQGRYAEQRDINQARYGDALTRADAATARGVEAQTFGRSVGAPSRDRYEGSYAPGFSMESDPGYTDAMKQASKATLHGLSMNGNPAGSPNAWATTLKDLYDKTAYPALQQYRSNNATTGGYAGFNAQGASAPGYNAVGAGGVGFGTPSAGSNESAAAIGANSNVFGALGKGLANVTNPVDNSLAELLKRYAGGGNAVFQVGQ